MAESDSTEDEGEELRKRRVPCMVAFLQPFRIVNGPESPIWCPTIEDINGRRWDYAELHRMVGGIDVGLPSPFHLAVFRDGAVALPPLRHMRNVTEGVEFINRCFAALLIGGVYCEAISLEGLDFGAIIDWRFLRIHSNAKAAANRFHEHVRKLQASALEAIDLMNPQTVSVGELCIAMAAGRALLDVVPEVSAEFILKGVTGLTRSDWGAALSNFWIVIEQITSNLWMRKVLTPAKQGAPIAGRVDQLSDFRTWTTATRHELLHQIGIVTRELLDDLGKARRARNALAHTGKHASEGDATSAFDAVVQLLKIAGGGLPVPLGDLEYQKYSLVDPFAPTLQEPRPINPTYWMTIPKLPGEAELERLEAAYRSRRAG